MAAIGATVLVFSGGKAGSATGFPIPSYKDLTEGKSSITAENSKYSLKFIKNVEELTSGDLVVLEVFKPREGPFEYVVENGFRPSHIGVSTGSMKPNGTYDLYNQNLDGVLNEATSYPLISNFSHQSFYGAIRFVPKK
jgi:hypothetical protein